MICSCVFSLTAQETFTVTGVVIDENKEPISSAVVRVQGTTNATVTADDGSYSINNVTSADKLEISIVGYKTFIVAVGDKRKIDAQLQPDTGELEDVTVVAFGKQRKSSVIAAVETVNMADLKIPGQNFTNSFAGRIPGIISYQTSGEPGRDNAEFFIRGVATFGYMVSPLILIDGFESSTEDLARLRPDDVESFSILKDASATALYGARGANGILLIVTKVGKEGPLRVNARVDSHVASATKLIEMADAITYMRMYNEARITRDPSLGALYTEQKIQSTIRGDNPMIYPNVDWYEELFNKTTVNTRANVDISGGTPMVTYYVSGGYEHENGLLKVEKKNNYNNNISIDRFHLRTNVTFRLSKSTMLDTRITGRFEKYSSPVTSASTIFGMVMQGNPVDFPAVWIPDYAHQTKDYVLFGSTTVNGQRKDNPYAAMVRGYQTQDSNNMVAMATLSQDLDFITKNLKFEIKGAINTAGSYVQSRAYTPYYFDLESYNPVTEEYVLLPLNPTEGSPYLGEVSSAKDASSSYIFEARLDWHRTFGKHTAGAMVVIQPRESQIGMAGASIYETLPERNVNTAGRATYDYDSRYFFEFDFGYNGSEKFMGAKRFGFFPSFGAAWLVSNESFWKNIKPVLSTFKLRLTYGLVGNDNISLRSQRFFFLSDIRAGGKGYRWGETFSNVSEGYTINRYANPDITWETGVKYNIGLELGAIENRLNFHIDFHKDARKNIYMPREGFPSTTGIEANLAGNVGKAESKGFEAAIDYQQIFSKDFWMTGRFNFTYAVSKSIERDEKDYTDTYLKRVGYSLSQQWGLVAERLFVDEEEIKHSPRQSFGEYMAGDIKYTDINKDGTVNSNDAIPMGFPTVPEIQYGFGLSTGYKKADISFFFQGSSRFSFFLDPGGIAPFTDRRNSLAVVANDYWTVENPNVHAFWPRLSTFPTGNNTQNSSWWLRDGSFLRLKTIEMGYTLPVQRLIESARLYFSMENVFTISRFKLWDSEVGSNGRGYPLQRRFNLGVHLMF